MVTFWTSSAAKYKHTNTHIFMLLHISSTYILKKLTSGIIINKDKIFAANTGTLL